MITDDEIRAVARLARLDLAEEEIHVQRAHMNALLERIAVIGSLSLRDTEPTAHCTALADVMRDDVAEDSLPRVALLAGAPEARDGLFIVPRILDA